MVTTQNQHNFKVAESIYDDFQDGKVLSGKSSAFSLDDPAFLYIKLKRGLEAR